MFCKKCGKPMADNAKFCGSCGAAVVQETPAQPVNNPIPTPAVPNEQKISEVIPEIPTIATTTQVNSTNKKPGVNPVIIALGAVVAVLIAVIVFLSMVADTYFTAIVCLVYDTQVFLNSSIGVIDSIFYISLLLIMGAP